MFVGVIEARLRLAETFSLKDKRQIVRGLIEAARHRYHASVAEVDEHDQMRSATVGVAVVSGSAVEARKILGQIEAFFGEHPSVVAIDALIEVLPIP
jgi:uncharacterized protein YlxP (DUF503 family)